MLLYLQDYGTSFWQLTFSSYQLVRPFDRASWALGPTRPPEPLVGISGGVDRPKSALMLGDALTSVAPFGEPYSRSLPLEAG